MKSIRSMISFIPGGTAFMGLVTAGVIAIFAIGSPVQNMQAEQPVRANDVEIPSVNELTILNSGLTGVTLNWSFAHGNAKVATYRIYMDDNLISTVDGSVHTYTVTRLRPGGWYQFHVDACDASGKCSTGGLPAGARTVTVQEATEAIIDKVGKLVSTGVLTANQGDSLIKNISAIYQLDQGNANTVTAQFQAFIDDVNSLAAAGVLSPEAGRSLTDAADDVIRNIKG